ncbi:uncharacterized protein MYCFIDRAFT_78050 [Pseudocercospora fijiensis CIRAD86]|uniref:C2H2-type domain-containing protein n=1 Tax=Pseudocercospora fijiensis (strain CIRAD86) TaxID=383855 RepID=M2ZMI8_PSEFD|nr:uncharacterized protein MYCFIDRAFT_78050 [Pseudocercospora fijiensis CIRAD86]EME80294.1 hypothetical protein MYCFIDRAFT_78050 [Pseudocercospora fijiensis CIRAD86]
MPSPTSPGPSSPVSSSSTGVSALTPPSTDEQMNKVRLLASLEEQELEGHTKINAIQRTPEDRMQCALCGVVFTSEEDFEKPCLFHPGLKDNLNADPNHSDDEAYQTDDSSGDADETDDSSGDADETDDSSGDADKTDDSSGDADEPEWTYRCCKGSETSPGCVVEATHKSFHDLVASDTHWKYTWAQREVQWGSSSDSEQ